jgi:hypothetical protein
MWSRISQKNADTHPFRALNAASCCSSMRFLALRLSTYLVTKHCQYGILNGDGPVVLTPASRWVLAAAPHTRIRAVAFGKGYTSDVLHHIGSSWLCNGHMHS